MKKIYSLLIALLVAGSMMATTESVNFSQQGYADQQYVEYYSGNNFGVIFDENTSGMTINHAKYFTNGNAIRVYAGGNFQVHVVDSFKISSIVIGFGSGDGANGNDNPLTPSIGQFDGTTWTGNASKVKFTVGAKSDGTNGGHRRIQSLKVTYHRDTSGDDHSGIDPSVNVEAYLGYAISIGGHFVRNPEVYGEWMLIYPRKFEADYGVSVHIENPEDVFGCPASLPGCYELIYYPAPNESCPIEEAGWHNIYFRPNRDGGDGWCRGCIKIEHLPQGPDPTNFYEASLFAGQEDENAMYNNGKTYTLEGYVKEIKEAYQDKYHNMSFWLSDKMTDTWNYVLAFRAACPKASHAVQVGDKVRITGSLMRYNSYYVEYVQGCTYEILNREEVDPEPEPSHEGLEDIDALIRPTKTIRDGQLLIERNGKLYNVSGAEVK